MDATAVRMLLDQLLAGQVDADEVVRRLRVMPFTELGYATVDHHRELRHGLPEAVYAPGKTPAQCAGIVTDLLVGRRRGRVGVVRLFSAAPTSRCGGGGAPARALGDRVDGDMAGRPATD